MNPLLTATPRLILVGRKDRDEMAAFAFQHLQQPLPHGRILLVEQGRGRLRQGTEDLALSAGSIVWLQPGSTCNLLPQPPYPLSIYFLEFEFIDDDGKQLYTNSPIPIVLPTICIAESLIRSIINLQWECYTHAHTQKRQDSVPNEAIPQLLHPTEVVAATPVTPGSACPPSISIIPARDAEFLSASLTAGYHFKSLIAEICYHLDNCSADATCGLEKHHRDLIQTVALQIRKDPCKVRSIESLATEAGYSSDHFTRTFKKVMGCPPQQFLVNCRIAHAKELLLKTGLSIKEISRILGYRSAYFFSRQFKEITFQTPTRFRAAIHSKPVTQLAPS